MSVIFAIAGFGQSQEIPEFQLKAVFLHRFASFVEWPASDLSSADSTFTIGVLGRDPFGDALDLIQDRAVGGRPIEVRRFPRLEELEHTHILYVSDSETSRLAQVLDAVSERATLTVGDAARFTSDGGIIRFIVRDRRIRLEVNRCAADRAGLRISARLLQLAELTPDECGIGKP